MTSSVSGAKRFGMIWHKTWGWERMNRWHSVFFVLGSFNSLSEKDLKRFIYIVELILLYYLR